jgi:hypothetical protein
MRDQMRRRPRSGLSDRRADGRDADRLVDAGFHKQKSTSNIVVVFVGKWTLITVKGSEACGASGSEDEQFFVLTDNQVQPSAWAREYLIHNRKDCETRLNSGK